MDDPAYKKLSSDIGNCNRLLKLGGPCIAKRHERDLTDQELEEKKVNGRALLPQELEKKKHLATRAHSKAEIQSIQAELDELNEKRLLAKQDD